MAYKVIATFRDLLDNNHKYQAGETFPREGKVATKERIEELASNKNKYNKAFIEYVPDEPRTAPKKEEADNLPAEPIEGQEEAKSEPKKASKKRSTKKKS